MEVRRQIRRYIGGIVSDFNKRLKDKDPHVLRWVKQRQSDRQGNPQPLNMSVAYSLPYRYGYCVPAEANRLLTQRFYGPQAGPPPVEGEEEDEEMEEEIDGWSIDTCGNDVETVSALPPSLHGIVNNQVLSVAAVLPQKAIKCIVRGFFANAAILQPDGSYLTVSASVNRCLISCATAPMPFARR